MSHPVNDSASADSLARRMRKPLPYCCKLVPEIAGHVFQGQIYARNARGNQAVSRARILVSSIASRPLDRLLASVEKPFFSRIAPAHERKREKSRKTSAPSREVCD